MTTPRVSRELEVSLNGNLYKLSRPVKTRVIPPYPTGADVGDTRGDIPGRVRRIRWTSAQGGIGKKDHERDEDVFRIWYGTSWLRQEGYRTLTPRVTTTAASGVSGLFEVGIIAELASELYAAFSTSVRKYSYNSDSWGGNLHTLAALPTDSLTCRLSGTVYMIIAYGTGYVDTTDGSTFNNRTTDAEYLACWDDRLWGIDSTGQLRWTFTPSGTWVDDAQLPLPTGYVQDLFVDRDAGGERILYASTKEGLFAHDAFNNRFVPTEMSLPFHDDAGAGATIWRGASYIPAGLGIYEYRIGGGAATIRAMGPDRDSGLPSNKRGKVVALQKTHNDLVALVDSTSAEAETLTLFASSGASAHMSPAMDNSTGRSLVMGWDGFGWQVLFQSDTNTEPITTAIVSSAYNGYRFWFGHNRVVKYFDLPIDVVNPSEITDREYADSSSDEYPDFNAGRSDVDKIAVRLNVEVAGTSSSETVTPYYALNGSTSFTTLSSLTSDGVHTYHFPGTTAGDVARTSVGTAFRSFRPRVDMANGTNNKLSPDIRAVELEYREKLPSPSRNVWEIEIDLENSHSGLTPNQMRENIKTAQESNLLVEFTYRDDTGDDRNYPVEVASVDSIENTGHDETGLIKLILTQV